MPHPRAYGNFARLLGKYVREEKLLPLQDAIRKLSHLPASNLGLDRRGLLKEGYFADVVVFDPNIIADASSFSTRFGLQQFNVSGGPTLQVLQVGVGLGMGQRAFLDMAQEAVTELLWRERCVDASRDGVRGGPAFPFSGAFFGLRGLLGKKCGDGDNATTGQGATVRTDVGLRDDQPQHPRLRNTTPTLGEVVAVVIEGLHILIGRHDYLKES